MGRKEAPVRVRLNTAFVWEQLARHNYSQNELARRLGITSGYLSQLINGRRRPSPEMRRRLLHVLSDSRFEELFTVERQGSSDGKVEEGRG